MVAPMVIVMVVMVMLTWFMVAPVVAWFMVAPVVAWFMVARLFHLLVGLQQHSAMPWPADRTFQRVRSNVRTGIGDQVTNAVLRNAINIQNRQMCEMLALRFGSALALNLAIFGRPYLWHLLIIRACPIVPPNEDTLISEVLWWTSDGPPRRGHLPSRGRPRLVSAVVVIVIIISTNAMAVSVLFAVMTTIWHQRHHLVTSI